MRMFIVSRLKSARFHGQGVGMGVSVTIGGGSIVSVDPEVFVGVSVLVVSIVTVGMVV